MKKTVSIIIILAASASFLYAEGSRETSHAVVTVFNAASTTDLVNEIGRLYSESAGITVKTNPASSGTLARQIEQGAEPDIFISASAKWMEYVKELELVSESMPFAYNRLVLIAPASTSLDSFEINPKSDLPSLCKGKFSMGDPMHVPAGKYAEEALIYFNWYDALSDRIVPAANVRAALAVVELGEADMGIVYETDALRSSGTVVLSVFPQDSHNSIKYFAALINGSSIEAGDFFDYLLNDPEALEIYRKYGFSVIEPQ